MKPILFGGISFLFLHVSSSTGHTMSPQELCTKVFEQYGIRTEECGAAPVEKPRAQSEEISAEFRENHIFFKSGGVVLDDDAKLQLAILVEVLKTPLMKGACLRLVGHSDTSGSGTRNMEIALQRAEAVAAVLERGLGDRKRILKVSSDGEAHPIAGIPSASPTNRRVEIWAKDCPN